MNMPHSVPDATLRSLEGKRILLPLGGTDRGRSGIGIYLQSLMPHLQDLLKTNGAELIVMGTQSEIAALCSPNQTAGHPSNVDGCERMVNPAIFDKPWLSAASHLLTMRLSAKYAKADAILLPAANRRVPYFPGVKSLAVVHDLAQLHVPDKYDPMRMLYFEHGILGALKHVDRVVAVSEATAKDLRRTIHLQHDVRVVPNGVDTSSFYPRDAKHPEVAACRSALSLIGPYVLYASRLEHPGKNHIRLVRAFAESEVSHTHTLALAGADWGARNQILAEAKSLRISDRVQLLGYVPDEHMPGLIAGADLVVMAGLHEGFGLPALEAVASGVPVAASHTGALPEVVGQFGVLFDPYQESSIASALLTALNDSHLRSRCQEQGPVYGKKMGWDRSAALLIEVLAEMLSSNSAR